MFCKNCGRTSKNEEANFCDYCGASFRMANNYYQNIAPNSNSLNSREMPGGIKIIGEKPIVFKEWLSMLSICFVPYIGFLVFFIMLFIWAFGNKEKSKTRREWARAMLVFVAGIAVLVGFFFVGFMAALFGGYGA